MPVTRAQDDTAPSHIVCLGGRSSAAHDRADEPWIAALHGHLIASGVRHSVRRGLIRFSLHLYNTAEQVDRVLDLVAAWRCDVGAPTRA